MKYLILFIGVFVTFVLGYSSEPLLRDTLIAFAQEAEDEPPAVEEIVDPVREPQRQPEPEPEVVPTEEEVELPPPTNTEIRQIMSDSIEKAEIKHFTLSQVTDWKEFGAEEIDGEMYHYGLIEYVEETSLGVRPVEAKALIRNHKVEKWIWTRTEMRIE